jgi:hypothetical protein
MSQQPVIDERAVAVAGGSHRLAWMVLFFGCLIDIVVRGLVLNEIAWDLVALALASSVVGGLYMRAKNVQMLSRRQTLVLLIGAVVAAAVAAMFAVLRYYNR